MIQKETFQFLKELKKNNNRGWFEAHRADYEAAKQNFSETVDALILSISKFDPSVKNLSSKDCMFRIFRDVRFAKDKSPYKTAMGAILAPGGRKTPWAGYYLHVAPGDSMLAGGVYCPDPKKLGKIRDVVADKYRDLLKIIQAKTFRKYFNEIWGEKLKTAPKGFPKDHPALDLLQYKSYTVATNLPDRRVLDKTFVKDATGVFHTMLPFNTFLNRALGK